MRMRSVVVGIPGLFLLVGFATPSPGPTATEAPHMASPGRQDSGRAVFTGKGNCFTCHGRDATGTPLAPDLTDDEWVNFEARPTPEELRVLVREGVARPVRHPAPMPPMGGASLSDEEVAAVADYVLSLSGSGS